MGECFPCGAALPVSNVATMIVIVSGIEMAYPRKFQRLLEIERGDVPGPDYVWLVYAVCATSPHSCGWGGWMIEAAFQTGERGHPAGTGDTLVPVQDRQVCPRWGLELFRAGDSLRMVPSEDQTVP